jgi:hypothetical protein
MERVMMSEDPERRRAIITNLGPAEAHHHHHHSKPPLLIVVSIDPRPYLARYISRSFTLSLTALSR